MQIVSENSESEIARRQALGKIEYRIRGLTANILRVTRGAGKPWEIGRQIQSLIDATVAYGESAGHYPSPEELSKALSLDLEPEILARMNAENLAEIDAEQKIVRGALQIAASRLLGQRTQERAGDSEMHEGMRARNGSRSSAKAEGGRVCTMAQPRTAASKSEGR